MTDAPLPSGPSSLRLPYPTSSRDNAGDNPNPSTDVASETNGQRQTSYAAVAASASDSNDGVRGDRPAGSHERRGTATAALSSSRSPSQALYQYLQSARSTRNPRFDDEASETTRSAVPAGPSWIWGSAAANASVDTSTARDRGTRSNAYYLSNHPRDSRSYLQRRIIAPDSDQDGVDDQERDGDPSRNRDQDSDGGRERTQGSMDQSDDEDQDEDEDDASDKSVEEGQEPQEEVFFIPSYLQNSKYGDEVLSALASGIVQGHASTTSQIQSLTNKYQSQARNAHDRSEGLNNASPSHKVISGHTLENNLPRSRWRRQFSHSSSSSSKSSTMCYPEQPLLKPSQKISAHDRVKPDSRPSPLPQSWSLRNRQKNIRISGAGLHASFVGPSKLGDHEAAAVRASCPIPPSIGLYYYEVFVESKGKDGMIGIGFSSSKALLDKLPGWELESWAYHGDDGKSFCCQSTGKTYGPVFTTGDTIGCGIDFVKRTAFFTKNGLFLGTAFKDIYPISGLYPSVGMKRPHAHLVTNFGDKPFIFDIDEMMQSQQESMQVEISSAKLTNLGLDMVHDDICKALVAQYLSHDGYTETAKQFTQGVQREQIALTGDPKTAFDSCLVGQDDREGLHRQGSYTFDSIILALSLLYSSYNTSLHEAKQETEIRASITSGNMDKAIELIDTHFPGVLSLNQEADFAIRCRKFVEMSRELSDLGTRTKADLEPEAEINGDCVAMIIDDEEGEHNTNSKDLANGQHDMSLSMETQLKPEAHKRPQSESSMTQPSELTLNGSLNAQNSDQKPSEKDDRVLDDSCTLEHPISDQTESQEEANARLEKLSNMLAYGSELHDRFVKVDGSPFEERLQVLYRFFAYRNARKSPVANILDVAGRSEVAEKIGVAILESLGKPPTATIERMYKQTAALINILSDEGGPGSLVNTRHLLLQAQTSNQELRL